MIAYFQMFAGYNAWANRRLYAAATDLTEAQFQADCGAFFKSVQGTLNHLLVTDRIWLTRCNGSGPAPDRLDAILYERLDDLQAARQEEDGRILAYIGGLDETALAGTISYRRVSTPEPFVQDLVPALAHWFNHQTHHRGQVHGMLTALVGHAPELDLLFYQRAVAAGTA